MKKRLPPYHGYVRPGSWNPATNTVDVDISHLVGVTNEDGSAPLNPQRNVPLLTHGLGSQYGPRGWEVVTVLFRSDGPVAILQHEDYNTPAAPSGESHRVHYNAQGQIDVRQALTNDGAVSGDAAGGFSHVGGSLYKFATAGGLSIVADDNAQTITLTAGSLAVILDKATGEIYLGKSGLGSSDAVVTESKAQTLANAIIAHVQTALNTLAALVQSGSGVAAPMIAAVTASGSSEVESAE